MPVPARKKDSYLWIQKRSGAVDAAGQAVPDDWVNVTDVWAWSKSLSGRAGLRGNVMTAINGYSWRIDYSDSMLRLLNVGMRVLHNGIVFEITRIIADFEKRNYIDLICEEGGSNG